MNITGKGTGTQKVQNFVGFSCTNRKEVGEPSASYCECHLIDSSCSFHTRVKKRRMKIKKFYVEKNKEGESDTSCYYRFRNRNFVCLEQQESSKVLGYK